jgi:hypothetical protein
MLSERLDESKRVAIPMNFLPIFRSQIAIQNGVEKNLLFKTWGGLGDQICAEPTLRFVLKNFKGCTISLASEKPYLFSHIKFHNVFDINEVIPNWDRYFVFDTITPPDDSNLVWQFFSHIFTNCVDFPALCSIRSQLPVADREIILAPDNDQIFLSDLALTNPVLVHAGRHWPSKTFPKDWWDAVLSGLSSMGIRPVLIGADTDDNRGTVDVDPANCLDLRNKLSVQQSIWLCQRARVLLTNDSSPLHMAASVNPNDESTGKTWIGYVATCKHPDYITHWRRNLEGRIEWQWREENLGRGGMWDIIDHCPNKQNEVTVDKVSEDILRSWLPDPHYVARWALEKVSAA